MNSEEAYYEAERFWEGGAVTDLGNMARFELTAEVVPRDVRTLLDAGCGNGVFGDHLRSARPEIQVTCMDRSSTALKYVKTQKLQGDVSEIPAEDRAYDCVTCLEVIEHLPVRTYQRALSELARVARRHLIVSVPYRERIEESVTRCPLCATIFNVDLHLRSFDDWTLARLFDGLGFRHVTDARPPPTREPAGLAAINRLRTRLPVGRPRKRFTSPICPVCGYSERREADARARGRQVSSEAPRGSGPMGRIKSAARSLARVLRPVWPHVDVQSYWTIYRYERL